MSNPMKPVDVSCKVILSGEIQPITEIDVSTKGMDDNNMVRHGFEIGVLKKATLELQSGTTLIYEATE